MELAVIKTGGKQYVAKVGDLLTIEKLPQQVAKGDVVTFDEVLLNDKEIGTPTIAGAKVTATVEMVGRAKKVEVVKYKAKSNYLKRRGHRQPYVKVRISAIA